MIDLQPPPAFWFLPPRLRTEARDLRFTAQSKAGDENVAGPIDALIIWETPGSGTMKSWILCRVPGCPDEVILCHTVKTNCSIK